jgi:hypothetical protein
MAATRHWLLPLAQNFPLHKAHTRTGPIAYTTLGVCVPVDTLLKALPQTLAWKQEGQTFKALLPPQKNPKT